MKRALILLTFIVSGMAYLQAQVDCQEGNCIDGEGVCVYPSGARYEGQFENGRPDGKGNLYFSDGRVYRGDWKAGFKEGIGMLSYPN
ncbi:MAG: peptidase C14 caspase catalytic subunit p20, partial [Bacteroidetes bacterium]|nr:peptidase C14 caspase catalytic subunit p20 [Bacteroidota bacterium]